MNWRCRLPTPKKSVLRPSFEHRWAMRRRVCRQSLLQGVDDVQNLRVPPTFFAGHTGNLSKPLRTLGKTTRKKAKKS
jgi:hypothetical protein